MPRMAGVNEKAAALMSHPETVPLSLWTTHCGRAPGRAATHTVAPADLPPLVAHSCLLLP